MEKEGFLQRWSRLKGEERAVPAPAPPVPASAAEAEGGQGCEAALPTLADAAQLTADSDYSAFLARGVDQDVRRLAMKKLFSDPHFNLIDGLDIYMGDYNQPDPVTPAMLAALHHAQDFLARAIEPGPSAQGGDPVPGQQGAA